jgi:hypothetical protein
MPSVERPATELTPSFTAARERPQSPGDVVATHRVEPRANVVIDRLLDHVSWQDVCFPASIAMLLDVFG